MTDSFGARSTIEVGGREYEIHRLDALQSKFDVARLPYSIKVLLENVLRLEDGESVTAEDVETIATWDAKAEPAKEIPFQPARVLMQDFTGVPAVVDLAAMRDAMEELGSDAAKINPLVPVDLVIDHSVQVDAFGNARAFEVNAEREFERNEERYEFLRWGQKAFDNFSVVPPATGICHQVNLEYLGRVVWSEEGGDGPAKAYPDTLVGTDSHTTMINGLSVLGWGVGGIEAEAAMLGQPISMLLPQVIGFRLEGELREGATATDLVLRVTEMLRERGVVSKFVEFFGPGLPNLGLADRATLGNMSPEFGSTCAICPPDAETLRYLEFTGRPTEVIELADAYTREQGMFHTPDSEEPTFSDTLELDLGDVEPAIAGPKRPQDRIALTKSKSAFLEMLRGENGDAAEQLNGHDETVDETFPASDAPGDDRSDTAEESSKPAAPGDASTAVAEPKRSSDCVEVTDSEGNTFDLDHGRVVIAAITSCTNTSNPSVMIGAGLLARNAVERGLDVKPWVKTSLAPGSTVVTDYLEASGLDEYLNDLKFDLVGYGCTTCIGNSGPLPEEISKAVNDKDLVVAAVLSGNRNFEGRINQDVRANYLASPPLCVAYALAGRMDFDFDSEPLGTGKDGEDVFLRDIWPGNDEIRDTVADAVRKDMFEKNYANVFDGDERWQAIAVPEGDRYTWPDSTYVRRPPFFEGMDSEPAAGAEAIEGARVLAKLGDSITTDHISPAGAIKRDSPAGRWLQDNGVEVRDFNSYGSRRGNHEVMMRGTFANIRLRNELVDKQGGWTRHMPSGEEMFIYDAAMKYAEEGVPLVVLAGKEYGSGSSRDWAAKGTLLLGVKAVIAESFERIHRSNLIGMGVLPLQFPAGESIASLGLTGEEEFSLPELDIDAATTLAVTATREGSDPVEFEAQVRLDTANERQYYRHGGILHRVLRELR
ncbi:MAG: aconitate hydratase [Solirubrobacterales bacterium]|nr:aconitate hydratase [Solirubrobacterales bacterium]MCB8971304.1 aconitate hydratase [Thermoleophilales bacterium]MCO5325838.1 aconitate hydratase [Solirubrobacterales bacterium]